MSEEEKRGIGTILLLGGMFLAAMFLWNTFVMFPIKAFVVFLHELSHGIAAILTGGRMLKIELSPQMGGTCFTQGGLRTVILPAGYLGSMLFGGIILIGASRTKMDKIISIVIGIITVLITLFFVRTVFGIVFGLVFGVAMFLIGFFVARRINDFILRFIGMTSSLYAIIDIKDDLIVRTVPGSDAYAMSEIIPLPPVVWGVIWIVVALVATFFFFRIAAKGEVNIVSEKENQNDDKVI